MSQTQTVVTHSGNFHPDEVFACATLELYYGQDAVSITRTRETEQITEADIVVDVGGVYDPETFRFDHHQNNAPVRQNGIPYAAFGLVWKHYGKMITDSDSVTQYIEQRVAQPIDAGDNGVSLYELNEHDVAPFELFHVISSFRPQTQNSEEVDNGFMAAVTFARQLLTRLIEYQTARESWYARAHELYQSHPPVNKILTVPEPVPTDAYTEYDDVVVVVRPDNPSENNNWIAKAVPKAEGTFANKVEFPAAWGGLTNKELEKVSGIPGARFCHRAGFIFVASDQAGAVAAAQRAV